MAAFYLVAVPDDVESALFERTNQVFDPGAVFSFVAEKDLGGYVKRQG